MGSSPEKMWCLLSCHVVRVVARASKENPLLCMFVLKSDPRVCRPNIYNLPRNEGVYWASHCSLKSRSMNNGPLSALFAPLSIWNLKPLASLCSLGKILMRVRFGTCCKPISGLGFQFVKATKMRHHQERRVSRTRIIPNKEPARDTPSRE